MLLWVANSECVSRSQYIFLSLILSSSARVYSNDIHVKVLCFISRHIICEVGVSKLCLVELCAKIANVVLNVLGGSLMYKWCRTGRTHACETLSSFAINKFIKYEIIVIRTNKRNTIWDLITGLVVSTDLSLISRLYGA